MPKERGQKVVATNRKARYDYFIEDTYEAGMVLTGTEVKSLRLGRASLVDGYATIQNGEVWLENVHIPEFTFGSWTNHSTRRRRKLLLNRAEIMKIQRAVEGTSMTLIPLSLYFSDGKAKLELAVARGKKHYDKRETLKRATDEREAKRAMAQANRGE